MRGALLVMDSVLYLHTTYTLYLTMRTLSAFNITHRILIGRPMSCMQGYREVVNPHNIGSLTIPRASIIKGYYYGNITGIHSEHASLIVMHLSIGRDWPNRVCLIWAIRLASAVWTSCAAQ